MKNYVYFLLIGLSISSCGGGGDSSDPSPPPVAENKAPSAPMQSEPTNNKLCIDNTVNFSWNASTDPEGKSVSYELQIAKNNTFTENLQTKNTNSPTISVTLEKGVAYYWRIKAKDDKNASSNYSSTYNFYTEGEGVSNHLPFSPTIVTPELNTIVQEMSVDLKWAASDVDNDVLSFDVYFDIVNPPSTKIADDISETAVNRTLDPSKTYYWKVVVNDGKGGICIGQVWSFKTD